MKYKNTFPRKSVIFLSDSPENKLDYKKNNVSKHFFYYKIMVPNTFFYPAKNYQQNFSNTKINTIITTSNTSFIVTSSKLFGFSLVK